MRIDRRQLNYEVLISAVLISSYFFELFNKYTFCFFLIAIFAIYVLLIGGRVSNNHQFNTISLIIILVVFVSVMMKFVIGFKTGFYINTCWQTPFATIHNLLWIIGVVIMEELLRFYLTTSVDSTKLKTVFNFVMFSLLLVSTQLMKLNLTSKRDFEFYWLLFLYESIASNILYFYLTKQYGYRPVILLRLLSECYIYFLPILPDLGDYLTACVNQIVPIMIYLYIKWINAVNDHFEVKESALSKIITVVLCGLALIVCALNSNLFRFYSLVVVSGSMVPNLEIGDVIIVDKKYSEYPEKLEVGDIIVFNAKERIVSHRIIKINEKDGHRTIQTKGDALGHDDDWTVQEEDIIGLVKTRVRYVGYLVMAAQDLKGDDGYEDAAIINN